MKRILLIICACYLILSNTACAQNKQGKERTIMKKTLVAYFSATGVTHRAAEQLAKEKNADIFEIVPQQPYTRDDLDWTNNKSRSSVEMQNPDSRPKIGSHLEHLDEYDTIYIGFPIWWYTAPTIINTFIESYDFSGKVLGTFATSGGSSIAKAADDLKKAYPQYQWIDGRLMN